VTNPGLDPSQGIERAREVGQEIGEFIKFADAKAGLVLTLVGAVGAVIGFTAPSALAAAREANNLAALVMVGAQVATAAAVALVVYFTFEAVYPRSGPALAPLVSFPDIAALKPADYADKFAQASPGQLLKDRALHNATLARIAMAKFAGLSRAMWWARVAIFGAYVAAVTYGVAEMVKPDEQTPPRCCCSGQ
jgi:hypothetical protein